MNNAALHTIYRSVGDVRAAAEVLGLIAARRHHHEPADRGLDSE